MEKTFMTNPLILIKKKYKEIRKLATGQGEDYTTGFLEIINLEKNQRNEIKIFSRKCNSIIKDGKLPRSES